MKHVYLSKDALQAILLDIATHVAAGDSFEGSIEYLLPFEDDDPSGFRVRASYRIGNLEGQGSLRIIGEMP